MGVNIRRGRKDALAILDKPSTDLMSAVVPCTGLVAGVYLAGLLSSPYRGAFLDRVSLSP